jgi:hypothetical protein
MLFCEGGFAPCTVLSVFSSGRAQCTVIGQSNYSTTLSKSLPRCLRRTYCFGARTRSQSSGYGVVLRASTVLDGFTALFLRVRPCSMASTSLCSRHLAHLHFYSSQTLTVVTPNVYIYTPTSPSSKSLLVVESRLDFEPRKLP